MVLPPEQGSRPDPRPFRWTPEIRRASRRGRTETGRRKRRHFTDEFNADTVWVVHEGGASIAPVAKDLDPTESALREWVAKAEAKRRGEDVLPAGERHELRRLRRENKVLGTERDILRRTAAFFARESS